MSNLAAVRAAAKETAANMTEIVKGGGTARLLPAGPAIVQMFSYVEFGNQPQEYQGKAKAPKPEVQLGFIIHGPQYANEDGTPYKIFPYAFSLDQNEKARAIAIFKAMNWRGTATHFSDFLGEAFIGKIVHEPKSKAEPNVIVSRLDLKGFLPPLDAMSGAPYAVPAIAETDLQYFFFEQPTIETWNALYQEGQYEDGGSKNRIQETICGATNFVGSALEALLAQSGIPVPVAKPRAAKAQAAALPGVQAGVQAALPAAGVTPVVTPLAQTPPQIGSVVTPAVGVVSQPVTVSPVQVAPVVMSVPIVPEVTFPSNPALPQVG